MAKNKEAERFQIGDFVLVAAEVRGKTEHRERITKRTELVTPRRGRIVGASRIQEGKVDGANGEGFLSQSGTSFVWLVRYGLTNRAVKVGPTDLRLEIPTPPLRNAVRWETAVETFPIQAQDRLPVDESEREWMRDNAQTAPRDAKGRFLR